jgi:NADH-quinone oxidoreductase subunit G
MPRPEQKNITITVDGKEIQAIEGTMLVDAAKAGDVEIPYFCYQPKLGAPVGACRMCMVEIEGIPKLQTSCSTAVRDGMVVSTKSDRVKEAQESVVEFLLVNHPLDCPVCDKGGECPLQDITFGWGRGTSRVTEPKRHYVKPIELSPLIALDRERCILCYRCVRFSQEIAEDWQLIFAERGANTFVATHDGHPYAAPFSGNIIELCPVGALTSQPYRFRARPWDIQGAGGICTLCPAQCNVEFTLRDEQVMRVLGRDHAEVDDGWLCDKGRFSYQAITSEQRLTTPLVRRGGELVQASWEEALTAAAALGEHRGATAALVGGQSTNEEGYLLSRLLREGLDCADIDSRLSPLRLEPEPVDLELTRALAAPALQATVPDLEWAHTVLVLGTEPVDDAPIFDLRIRKGVRRHGVQLAVASERPSTLDPNATVSLRYAPGEAEALLAELASALDGGAASDEVTALARLLADGGEDVVILWGEQIGAQAAARLLAIADRLGLRDRDGAGLLEIPSSTNARGLREAGALPNAGPGYTALERSGRSAAQIATAAAAGEVSALYLLNVDPVRDLPDAGQWDRALGAAKLVVAQAFALTDGLRAHADVIFPAEHSAEQEGTIVHPDGRLQRVRAGIPHTGQVRAGWWVIAEVAKRAGLDLNVLSGGVAFRQLAAAVPFYADITLDRIGGRGVRWPLEPAAAALPQGRPSAPEAVPASGPAPATQTADGSLGLGFYRPIWAAREVEISPALEFAIARQLVEVAPEEAERLGIVPGAEVQVSQNGVSVSGRAVVRTGVPAGTVFMATGIATDSANVLSGRVRVRAVEVHAA